MESIDRLYESMDSHFTTIDQDNVAMLQCLDQLSGRVSEMQSVQGHILTNIFYVKTKVSLVEQTVTFSHCCCIDPSPSDPSTSAGAPPPSSS